MKFCSFLEFLTLLYGDLAKIVPTFREFQGQNSPIWAAHTRTQIVLSTPPPWLQTLGKNVGMQCFSRGEYLVQFGYGYVAPLMGGFLSLKFSKRK